MSSHRFLFVRDHEEFFNWSDCIIALNVTKEALCEYMEKAAERYVLDLPTDHKNHIVDFIEHNYGNACMIKDLICDCSLCKSLHQKIQEGLLGLSGRLVLVEPLETVRSSNPWWILLKMNLNSTEKNLPHIQDYDLKQLCRIFQRCKLFESSKCIEKVIANRNALMHSSSNELSTETKQSYLSALDDFLNSLEFYSCPKVREAKDKIASLKLNNSQVRSTDENFDKLKKSIEGQIKAVEDDIKEFKSKQLNDATLQEIMGMIKNNKFTVEQTKCVQERREATLKEAVDIGRQDGEEALRIGGFVGEFVGGITGGAGAYVAGQFRRERQRDE